MAIKKEPLPGSFSLDVNGKLTLGPDEDKEYLTIILCANKSSYIHYRKNASVLFLHPVLDIVITMKRIIPSLQHLLSDGCLDQVQINITAICSIYHQKKVSTLRPG